MVREGADPGVGHTVEDIGHAVAAGVDGGWEHRAGDDALALLRSLRFQRRAGPPGQDPGDVVGSSSRMIRPRAAELGHLHYDDHWSTRYFGAGPDHPR
jgi:hypothetical protein